MYTSAILHIGMQKTGSTSVQRTLTANHDTLAQRGYYYPHSSFGGGRAQIELLIHAMGADTPGHITRRLGNDNAVLEYTRSLDKLLEHSSSSHLILSCEHLSAYADAAHVQHLKTELERFAKKTTIVAYIRDQVSLIPSAWAQGLKSGVRTPLQRRLANTDWLSRFDLMRQIGPWGDAFGDENVMVRKYQGDAIESFVRDADLPPDSLPKRISDANPSFANVQAELMIHINKLDMDPSVRNQIVSIFLKHPSNSPELALTEQQKTEVETFFRASNQAFFDRFLPGESFARPSPSIRERLKTVFGKAGTKLRSPGVRLVAV